MWTPIISVVVILFIIYMAVYSRLYDNLLLLRGHLSKIREITGARSLLSTSGPVIHRHLDAVILIYRKSVPLVNLLLLWGIGRFFRKRSFISAYNEGRPMLEWNSEPGLWTDLVRGSASKDMFFQAGRMEVFVSEMEAFVRVLDRLL